MSLVFKFHTPSLNHSCINEPMSTAIQPPLSQVKRKRVRVQGEDGEMKVVSVDEKVGPDLPSSMIVQFAHGEETSGPPIDIPLGSTIAEMEELVNTLLGNNEKVPYAFYVNDVEIADTLATIITLLGLSTEETLTIYYQPLSVFSVRPITRCTDTMPGHTEAVLHVSYSPDGKRLASGGGDMTVRFWDPNSCLPVHTCSGHTHHVLCTAWSPDGVKFAAGDRKGEIRLWNPQTGLQVGSTLIGHRQWITSLSWEPMHSDSSCSRVASSSKDATVKIWNVLTGRCDATISGHVDSVECCKWGGQGLLYTCSRDRTIQVWAVDGHGRSQPLLVRILTGHAHRVNHLALSCDYVCRTGPFDFEFHTIEDRESAAAQARRRYEEVVGTDGERLVSGSDDFTLFMWKPTEGKHPMTRMTGHQQLVNHIAFSPDARFVASASFDKKVKLWDGKTGRFITTLNGHVGSVYQVAWSGDSRMLISASKDSTVKLWSIKDLKKAKHTLSGHADEVYALDWAPNGAQAASGSKDRTIKVWRN